MKRSKTIAAAILAAILLLCSACGRAQLEPADGTQETGAEPGRIDLEPGEETADGAVSLQEAEEGDRLEDFRFTTLEGEQSALSDFQGQAVLVTFWATWCGYCIEEMPAFAQLKEDYGQQLAVLALDVDLSEEAEAASYAEEQGYDFVFAMDSEEVGSFLLGIPYTIVVNTEGELVYAQSGSIGEQTYEVFDGYIQQALNG